MEHDRIIGALAGQSNGVTGESSFQGHFTPTTAQTPFLVTRDPDNANKVIIGTDRAHARYGYHDWITGAMLLEKTTAETLTITTAGLVYYAIDTGEETATPTNAAVLPSTGINVPLAKVGFASSKITSITQIQWGNIVLAATAVPVQITAKVAYNKYTVDVFGNGRFEDDGTPYTATIEDATLWIYDIASSETIPNDTWVMAMPVSGHYEGQVPIWL